MRFFTMFSMALLMTASVTFAQEGGLKRLPDREFMTFPPEILEEYSGYFMWAPHKTVITVTVEDGKLYGQPHGKVKSELKAFDMDEFVIDGVGAELSFVRDNANKVVSMVLSQDGERSIADRMKAEEAKAVIKKREEEKAARHAGHNHAHDHSGHNHSEKKKN